MRNPFDRWGEDIVEKLTQKDIEAGKFSRSIPVIDQSVELIVQLIGVGQFQLTEGYSHTIKILLAKEINCICAITRLLSAGYYQQATSIFRDLLEAMILSRSFVKDPSLIDEWKSLDENKRRKEFRTKLLIESAEHLSGFEKDELLYVYDFCCAHGVHSGPDVEQILVKDDRIHYGPFYSCQKTQNLLRGLARMANFVAESAKVTIHTSDQKPEVQETIKRQAAVMAAFLKSETS